MELREVLKEVILEAQQSSWETGVARHLRVTPVARKAAVCIGVRRGGKSTYLFQRMKGLTGSGVSPQNILYLNFFDDRLRGLQQTGLGPVLEAYDSLYPEKKGIEKIYCFFDEIQAVPGWEPFVDRLLRNEQCEVFLTGSSARMLSKEIATQMRGRALSWEMFPFSFSEFLDLKGMEWQGALSTKKRLLVQKAFGDYWETGGFPEVANLDRRLRIKIHQEYFQTILFRDLIERYDIPHPKAVSDLAHWLIDNAASLYSINNLTGYLKSLGHRVPKSSVADYLEWFEDSYFLFTVRIFDASLARANTNPKKIYCIDHALVTSVGSGILVNKGHLLENLVFVALRRSTADIFYYRTRSGREIDFVAQGPDRARRLVQVCESLAHPETRLRETQALAEAMREMKLPESFLVTRHDEESIEVPEGIIHVLPAWRFLLGENM